jgi:hypothetical protein
VTREGFEQQLAQLRAPDEQAITSLVTAYLKDVDEGLTALVRLAGAGEPVGSKARSILGRLRETTAKPLGQEIRGKEAPETWMLLSLAKAVTVAEEAVTTRLKAALSDARRIEPPSTPDIEEQEPPFRVCDEAYLALRHISSMESSLRSSLESRRFLALPDEQKSEEIRNYVKTKSFTRFAYDIDEDEE